MFNFADNAFLNRSVALGDEVEWLGTMQNFRFAQRVHAQAVRMGRISFFLKYGDPAISQMTFTHIIQAVVETRACLDEMYKIKDRYVNELHELHQDTCSGSICCAATCIFGVIGIVILLAAGLGKNEGFAHGGNVEVLMAPIIVLCIAAFCCLLTACMEGRTRFIERDESKKLTNSIEAGHQKVTDALLEAISKLGEDHQTLSDVDMQRINGDERFPSEIKSAIFRAAGIEVVRQEGANSFLSNCCARIFGARGNVAATEMVVYTSIQV